MAAQAASLVRLARQLIHARSNRRLACGDLGANRLILLVADTRHNHEVLRLHSELKERFPIETRACLRALGADADPGGDCLVVL